MTTNTIDVQDEQRQTPTDLVAVADQLPSGVVVFQAQFEGLVVLSACPLARQRGWSRSRPAVV